MAATGSSIASRISPCTGHDRLRQAGDEVAAANLEVQLLFERPRRAVVALDLFGGALPEGDAVFLLDVVDDRVVQLVAADADRHGGDDAAERNDRHFGGAAADVDDHVAGRLVNGKARPDRGGHGLFDDVDGLAGAGELGRLGHGALLDTGDARRNADDHARMREPTLVHLLDEVAQHLFADVEVGDDAVLQRADRADVIRRAPDHALGFGADGQGPPVLDVDRDNRRLVQDDATPAYVDERVGGA